MTEPSPPRRMRRYAQGTDVHPIRTRSEIESLVTKHGATGYVAGWHDNKARVMFEMRGRRIRFEIALLPVGDPRFTRRGYNVVPPAKAKAAFEQYEREQWRLLLMLIKGKLEAIRNNAAIFDDEMLAYTVMPNGQTVGEWLHPQLETHLQNNQMPPLLT